MSGERIVVNIIAQAGTGKSTLARKLASEYDFKIFRPSDVIREYAKSHGISLRDRHDYVACHRIMMAEDAGMIIRPVVEDTANVCIDGLRVIAHAQTLRHDLGMRTLALSCPAQECFRRIMDGKEWRAYRDSSNITTYNDYLKDNAADNGNTDPLEPNVELVMEMHDLSASPIDASQPEEAVFTEAAALIRPLFCS